MATVVDDISAPCIPENGASVRVADRRAAVVENMATCASVADIEAWAPVALPSSAGRMALAREECLGSNAYQMGTDVLRKIVPGPLLFSVKIRPAKSLRTFLCNE